jgi:hypothetical protein
MSKIFEDGMYDHLAQTVTTLATCWYIRRTDGEEFFYTNHDQDLVVDGDTYVAAAGFQQTAVANATGLSVANLEVEGILDSDELTETDLRTGKFDYAHIEVFQVNWQKAYELVPATTFDANAQVSFLRGGAVSPDGTKIYLADNATDTIQQYSMLTPWDVTTMSYDSASLDVSAQLQVSGLIAISLSADGTKLYACDYIDSIIYQYNLGTPWDLSTASYASKMFDVSGVSVPLADICFKADGTKLYFIAAGDKVYQCTLATPWDLSTASYDAVSFTTDGVASGDISIKTDGTKFYVADDSELIKQYTMATPWDLSTASYDSIFLEVPNGTNGLDLTSDGKAFFFFEPLANVSRFRLMDEWDISSAATVPVENSDGRIKIKYGKFGEVSVTPRAVFRAELRGLAQQLSQQVVELCTVDCRTDFGSPQCKVPLAPDIRADSTAYAVGSFIRVATAAGDGSEVYENRYYECTTAGTTDSSVPVYDTTIGNNTTDGTAVFTARNAWTRNGVVTDVLDRRIFTVDVDEARAVTGWFDKGVLIWETGNNAGTAMEIKTSVTDTSGVEVTLFLGMPFEIVAGDKFRFYPGCDKRSATCIEKFNNIVNLRGEPYVPGQDQVFSYPDAR